VTRDELFIETLRDLEARVQPGVGEYEILMSSLLLRKLLLDGEPLMDAVNRDRRVRVTFLTNMREPIWSRVGGSKPEFWSIEDGLDPDTALAGSEPQELKRDAFLAHRVMVVNGIDISVHDLIDQAAHITGAVHALVPTTDKQRILAEVSARLRVAGYGAAIRPLQAVGRIVLRGANPLREAIEAES
jgi:hypothetical protein